LSDKIDFRTDTSFYLFVLNTALIFLLF